MFPAIAFAQGCKLVPTDKSAGKEPFEVAARFVSQLPPKSWAAFVDW